MAKLSRTDITAKIAEQHNITKAESERIIKDFLGQVADGLKESGDRVELFGFGNFVVESKPAREGRNPATGETMHIAAKNVIKFKASSALKNSVNE